MLVFKVKKHENLALAIIEKKAYKSMTCKPFSAQ